MVTKRDNGMAEHLPLAARVRDRSTRRGPPGGSGGGRRPRMACTGSRPESAVFGPNPG